MHKNSNLLTLAEIAARAGVHKKTVYRAVMAGKLDGLRQSNGTILVKAADAAAWIKEQRTLTPIVVR